MLVFGDVEDLCGTSGTASWSRVPIAGKVNPRLAGLSRNLGTLLLTAGRAQDAAAEFRRGLERAPDDADLRYGLGISLLSMGDTLGAVAGLCGALALRPGWKDAEAALAKAGGL